MGSFYFNIMLKKITLPARPRMAWLYQNTQLHTQVYKLLSKSQKKLYASDIQLNSVITSKGQYKLSV